MKGRPLKYKKLSQEDEHAIRRALLIAEGGFEFPPEEGHERQEDGWRPFYDTVPMAQRTAFEMLWLKAENLHLKAQVAKQYAMKIGREYDIIKD